MDNTRCKKTLTILIVLTLAVIWGHSLLGKEASSEESSLVMEIVKPILELIVGKGNVTEHLVRKLAHFSEFSVLGTELQLFFALTKREKDAFLLSLAHGLFAALADETIQIFTGRGPMIQDVWIDVFGVTAGTLIALAATAAYKRSKRHGK